MNKKILRTKVSELSPKFLTQGAGYVWSSGSSQCCKNFKLKSAQENPTSQYNNQFTQPRAMA